jgi:hypothetical protein
MNKHVNRIFRVYKDATGLNHNNTVRPAPRDSMPAEVATELLVAPKTRLTNQQRKVYQAARQTSYESVFEAKTVEDKLAGKMRSASWNQLLKWNKRSIDRRADVQTAYLIAIRRRDQLQSATVDPKAEAKNMETQVQLAVLNRAIAGLELKAAQLDVFWSAVDDEFERRKKFFRRLETVSAEVAETCCNEDSKSVSCNN